MNTATRIRSITNMRGDAALYRFTPPLTITDYSDETTEHEYLIISAVVADYTGPEVLAFPANSAGEVESFLDVAGRRGTLSHQDVIDDLLDMA